MFSSTWFKEHYRLIWWSVFILSGLPGISLVFRCFTNDLGINALETLQNTTGHWALVFLIISMCITPFRRFVSFLSSWVHARYGKRLSDWNWFIRMRRMIGVYCFAYALAHGLVYLAFDLVFDWSWAIQDIQEKPYILVGMATLLLLTPLAVTSTNWMMKRLGKNWKRLHQLIYVIAVMAILHYWLQSKVGVYDPMPYTIIILLLLGYRLSSFYKIFFLRSKDDDFEIPERDSSTGNLNSR